jgi:hypothetical protein
MTSGPIQNIEQLLRQYEGVRRRQAGLHALSAAAAGCLAGLLAIHLADLIFILAPGSRLVLRWLLMMAGVGSLLWMARMFLRRPSLARTAGEIEKRHPGARQDLSTIMQRSENERLYSAELVEGLAEQRTEWLKKLQPSEPKVGRKVPRWLLAGLATAWLLLAIISPSSVRLTFARLAQPCVEHGDWRGTTVLPGDSRVPLGERLVVEVRGRTSGRARLTVEGMPGSKFTSMLAYGDGALSCSLPETRGNFRYRVLLGRMQSRTYAVTAFQPLALNNIRLRLEHPAYTGIEPSEQWNDGNVSALTGTKVRISAEPTQPVSDLVVHFASGHEVKGSASGGTVLASFAVSKSDRYRLVACGAAGDTFVSPEYGIEAFDDRPPVAELMDGDGRPLLGSDMAVPISGRGSDDYGLTQLRLAYQHQGRTLRLSLAEIKGTVLDTTAEAEWSLANQGLLPGDSLVYWLEAVDNDRVSGPKVGRSRARKLWVPTVDQLYRAAADDDSARIAEMSRLQPEQAELKNQLERLAQSLKENRKIDWQQKAAIEEAVQKQQKILAQMEQTADQVLQSLREDGQQLRIDQETASKLRELKELFDQVSTPEMRQAMERLSRALETMDRQEVTKALEQMNLTSEELKQRLDQAITALKELQQLQQLERMEGDLRDLIREQRDIKAATATERRESGRADLAERQKQAAQDLASLAQQLKQFAQRMEEGQPQTAQGLRESAAKMDRSGTPNKMHQAGQRIEDRNAQGAQELQQQAIAEMGQLAADLGMARGSMRQARNRAAAQAIRRKAKEIIGLSQQQEDLNRQINQGAGQQNELANRQQMLSRAAAKLRNDLSGMQQKGIMIPPQAAGGLSQAVRAMGQTGDNLMNSQPGQAQQSGRQALAMLNQSAASLLEAAGRSGGQGGGDMMQELEGLSGQQAEVNQQSLGMMPSLGPEPERLSAEARGQMARLAAEQEAVRQGLSEFNRRYGDRQDRSGRLDDLADEMERVIEDIRQQRMDDRTIERQDRILNRLLDAQRSLRDQDYSKERQSEPGREAARTLRPGRTAGEPGSLPPPPADRSWRKEPSPIEYRDIIEEYFRSLGW